MTKEGRHEFLDGLGHSSSYTTSNTMRKPPGRGHDHWPRYGADLGLKLDRHELDVHIIPASRRSPTDLVLDLGCGTGWHMIELKKEGFTCYGVDANAYMLQRGIELEEQELSEYFGCSWEERRLEIWKAQGLAGCVGLALLNGSLQYLRAHERRSLLEQISKAQPVGGMLLIKDPSLRYPPSGVLIQPVFEHRTLAMPCEIISLTAQVGYELISVKPQFCPLTAPSLFTEDEIAKVENNLCTRQLWYTLIKTREA